MEDRTEKVVVREGLATDDNVCHSKFLKFPGLLLPSLKVGIMGWINEMWAYWVG